MSKKLIAKQELTEIERGIQLRDSNPQSPVENQLWLNDSNELKLKQNSEEIVLSDTYLEGTSSVQVISDFEKIYEENPYAYTNTVGGAANGGVISVAYQNDGKAIVVGSFTTFGGVTRNYIVRLNADRTEDVDFYNTITIGGAFNGAINSVAIQSDGKIILGGAFTLYKGNTRNRLVRLNVDGTEDTAFYTNLGTGGLNGVINARQNTINLQSDGKILIAGEFTAVGTTTANRFARLNPNGTPDTAFITNLNGGANASVWSTDILPDGKIVVGGSFTTFGGVARNYITLRNLDGTEDTSFYNNLGKNIATGVASTAFNGVVDILKYHNQKIIIGGAFTTINGQAYNRLARLNLDGTLDRDFQKNIGTGLALSSQAIAPYGNDNNLIILPNSTTFNGVTVNRVIALNWDGTVNNKLQQMFGSGFNDTTICASVSGEKIIVGGSFTTVNGITKNRIAFFENVAGPSIRWDDGDVFKYQFSPGELSQTVNFDIYKIEEDEKFYGNLKAAFNGIIRCGVKQPDGKLILGGEFTAFNGITRNRIIRLNADGTEDTAFSAATGSGAAAIVDHIELQPDGKIIVTGQFTTFNGVTRNYIVRLNSDGTLDTLFTTNIGTAANNIVYRANTQTIDGQLKILLAGNFTTFNGVTRNRFVRLNADGTVDADFYTNLRGGLGNNSYAIEVLDDNKIAIGGIFTTVSGAPRNRIAIIRPDGYEDGSFTELASDGTRYAAGRVYQTLTQPDGKVIVCGDFTYEGVTGRSYLIRLNADGTLDRSFVANATDTSKFNALIYRVALQPNGQILVAGNFTNYAGTTGRNRLIRLNPNGTTDTAFCTNASDGAKIGASVWDVHVQPNGQIVFCGEFISYAGVVNRSYVARLNPDGNVDSAFCTNAVDGTKFNAICYSIVSNSLNQIFIGGNYTAYAGTANRNRLVALNNDGTLDTTFTAAASDAAKFNAAIYKVFVQANGQVLAGGEFTAYAGTANRNRLVRLNTNGTTDTTFCTNAVDGAKFSAYVWGIAEDSSNRLVIGGNFAYTGAAGRNYLIRLNSDGTTDTAFCVNASDGAKIAGASPSAEVRGVEVQSDDKVIFSGAFSNYSGLTSRDKVIRVNSDGTQELSFNRRLVVASSLANHGFSGGALDVWQIKKDQYGLVVAGGFVLFNGNTRNRMVRIGFDGTEDTAFYAKLGLGFSDYVYGLQIDSKGKVYATGLFTQFNSKITNRIVSLNPDGTEDYKFNAAFRQRSEVDWIPVSRQVGDLGGYPLSVTPESNAPVRNIIVDSNEYIVFGEFTRFDSLPRNRITKYTQKIDGSIDFDMENTKNWVLHDGDRMLTSFPAQPNQGITTDRKGNWIVCADFHAYRSLNNGVTWEFTNLNEDVAYREIATDEKGIWVIMMSAGGVNRIIKSTNNGANWVVQSSIESNPWFSVATDKKGTWIAVATTGTNRIVRSTDNTSSWSVQPSPTTAGLFNVKTDGNGTWVALANSGTDRVIRSTNNGATWQIVSVPEDGNDWSGLETDGNGNWIATSTTGTNRMMISSDNGATWTAKKMFPNEWTPQVAAEANQWYSITYANDLFVSLSITGTNRVMTSPDGITWTPQVAAEANQWSSITYGNGLFVAVAASGTNRVMTSPDAITWTPQTASQANSWSSVAFGNGRFVAVSTDGTNRVMTSLDTITWTAQTASQANQWRSVTFGNGLFVAVSFDGTNRVMTSPDGVTWTNRTAAEANQWRSVTYGDGRFVAVASSGTNRVMTSFDGLTWTARAASEANSWSSVTYGGGLFVAVSFDGTNRVMTSPDGVAWAATAASEQNEWRSVVYGDESFVAVASDGTNRVMTISDENLVALPNNNNEWRSITTDKNGIWVTVASTGPNRIAASYDGGVTWEVQTAPAQNPWYKIATDEQGTWIAVANNNSTYRVMRSFTPNRERPVDKTVDILLKANEGDVEIFTQTVISE